MIASAQVLVRTSRITAWFEDSAARASSGNGLPRHVIIAAASVTPRALRNTRIDAPSPRSEHANPAARSLAASLTRSRRSARIPDDVARLRGGLHEQPTRD